MKLKRILVIFILFINILLSGCGAGRELNTLGIVTSVGVDKSETGYLVTYQLLNPKAIASKKATNEAPIIIYTETGRDFSEIKRKITEQSPRKMYDSHLRTVVFSEEIAKEGLQSTLDFITRGREYRTDVYFLVAKGITANKFLSVITPLEAVSGIELYTSLETSEKEWAPTKTIKIVELLNDLISGGKNPVLTGVDLSYADGTYNSLDSQKRTNPPKVKLAGLGAFKKDKLAGWLTEDESKGYNYIMGNVKSTAGYLQYDDQNQVTFEVIKSDSKTKVYTLNGKPAINVEVNIKIDISSITGDIDLTDKDIIDKIRNLAEEKTKKLCYSSVKRAKDDLGTDIFGFGEEIHKKYPKLWKNISEDWNNEFVNLPVNITVKADVNSLGENTKSILSKGNH